MTIFLLTGVDNSSRFPRRTRAASHDIAIRFLALVQRVQVVSVGVENIFAILQSERQWVQQDL